jgi:threonine/homoserine/homoserine lactone efflux protein
MFLSENNWIQVLYFCVFIGLGLYNLFRKTNPQLKSGSRIKKSDFIRGLLVSIGNPQAIPFWIFVLAYLAQHFDLNFMGQGLVWFLVGVFIGKLLALILFGMLSNYLKKRLKESCNLINKFMGSVLLIIGLIQAFKYFF